MVCAAIVLAERSTPHRSLMESLGFSCSAPKLSATKSSPATIAGMNQQQVPPRSPSGRMKPTVHVPASQQTTPPRSPSSRKVLNSAMSSPAFESPKAGSRAHSASRRPVRKAKSTMSAPASRQQQVLSKSPPSKQNRKWDNPSARSSATRPPWKPNRAQSFGDSHTGPPPKTQPATK